MGQGQNHVYTVYIWCFGRKITKYKVINSVNVRFWPTYKCANGAQSFALKTQNLHEVAVSELTDLLLTGEDQSQADQPNSLAEGPPM